MQFGQGNRGMGDGLLDNAAGALDMRAYQLYKQEAEAMGEPVMSPEEWAVMQQQQQQPPPQQAPTPAPTGGAIQNPAMMAQMLRS